MHESHVEDQGGELPASLLKGAGGEGVVGAEASLVDCKSCFNGAVSYPQTIAESSINFFKCPLWQLHWKS